MPKRHKSENTFRFQSFNERLSSIRIDTVRRLGPASSYQPEEQKTFFSESLEKWRDLNCSESFEQLRHSLDPFNAQSLAQLLLRKDDLVQTLLEHLKQADILSLQPTLELVVALSNDLQSEFYPYFPSFFISITSLLHTRDADQLEWSFTCLAFLFKSLWRYLVRDMNSTYTLYSPLLATSQPQHVRNFAAESFAFLVRKVRAKKDFLKIVFGHLKTYPGGVAGVGRLLFEAMKGVQHQFHSEADTFLSLLLDLLEDNDLPQDLLAESLQHCVVCAAKYTQGPYCTGLWDVLLVHLGKILDAYKPACATDTFHIVLRLVMLLARHKQCSLVTDAERIAIMMGRILSMELPEEILDISGEVAASLLSAKSISFSVEAQNKLLFTVFGLHHCPQVAAKITRRLFRIASFESQVLPRLINFSNTLSITDTSLALSMLAELVLMKSPPLKSGIDTSEWASYPLDFSMIAARYKKGKAPLLEKVLGTLVPKDVGSALTDGFSNLMCAVICTPHLKPMKQEKLVNCLSALVRRVAEFLESTGALATHPEHVGATQKGLILASLAVEAILHINASKLGDLLNVALDFALTFASSDSSQLCCQALRIINFLLTGLYVSNEEVPLDPELLDRIFPTLEIHIMSPFGQMRLLTLHSLSLFSLPVSSPDSVSVFQICLAAEVIQPTVLTYRQKLKQLQKLEFSSIAPYIPAGGKFDLVPLRYIIGMLYVNFSLVWEPSLKLVQSHSLGLPNASFWPVWLSALQRVAQNATRDEDEVEYKGIQLDLPEDVLKRIQDSVCGLTEKSDHLNHRVLLWKAMESFADLCEKKNRDVNPLVLDFISKEYNSVDSALAIMVDLRKPDLGRDADIDDVVDFSDNEEEDEEEEEENEEEEGRKQGEVFGQRCHTSRSKKAMLKSLKSHLSLVSKFHNPRAMYKEEELRKVYLQLLSSRVAEVQKLALDCLMTYGNKAIVPYQEHLYGFLDDEKFRTEVVAFPVDLQSSTVQPEHRAELIPVLLRILYGKMQQKIGSKASGKANINTRRNLVVRYLTGCTQEELQTFMELAFGAVTNLVKDKALATVEAIHTSLDLSNCPSPGKLHSWLHLSGVLVSKMGNLAPQMAPFLLKVVLAIITMSIELLKRRSEISKKHVQPLKAARTSAMLRLVQFFDQFRMFEWEADSVEAVFCASVWPLLERLPSEGVYSPTPLLKLMVQWSQEQRFFVLFAKFKPDSPSVTPLPILMDLLNGERTTKVVQGAVLGIVERLLEVEEDGEDNMEVDVGPPVHCEHCLDVTAYKVKGIKVTRTTSYGVLLLWPHLGAILSYLHKMMTSQQAKKSSNKAALPTNSQHLRLLSRLSEFVQESTWSGQVLEMILPPLGQRKGPQGEAAVSLLKTAQQLVQNVDNPQKFVRILAPIFSNLEGRQLRTALCEVLQATTGGSEYEEICAIFCNLNAWNPNQADEPDYNLRLEAFSKLNQLWETGIAKKDAMILASHNLCFFIRTEQDMSLRNSSTHCLQNLCKSMNDVWKKHPEVCSAVLNEALMPLLRRGLREKTETARHEFISALGVLCRHSSNCSTTARDLQKLTNIRDLEADFFENICHVQVHRRWRALGRLSRHLIEDRSYLQSTTLTQVMLPLVSGFLFNENYSKHGQLIDAAIEATGAICRCLPWFSYEMILRFYLQALRRQLRFQKQAVRIVVAILNAFHFDLSNAEQVGSSVSMEVEPEPAEKKQVSTDESEGMDVVLETITASTDEEQEQGDTQKSTVLPTATATRIHRTICLSLLPELKACLSQRNSNETLHKTNMKEFSSDKEILRVPVALALIKLLQTLPKKLGDAHIPGVLLKLCSFLKSRAEDVRESARDTLKRAMESLGPTYFSPFLDQIKVMLNRGFHAHVLLFTLHSILIALKTKMEAGDLDECFTTIIELCHTDIFGKTAEEKEKEGEEKGNLRNVREARRTTAFDTYHLLAEYASSKVLMDLILPLKEVLHETRSHKEVKKVEECLQQMAVGLADNQGVDTQALIEFLYGVVSQSIPQLTGIKANKAKAKPHDIRLQPTDTFIIPANPGRAGPATKTSPKTNAHVLIHFGLALLHLLLKRGKVTLTGDTEEAQLHRSMLDPLVCHLVECLKSPNIKLVAMSVRCTGFFLKHPSPAVKKSVKTITETLFVILHKYAAPGASHGDNLDLLMATFKTVTVLVRDASYYVITSDQLRVLLIRCEQDLEDSTRQSTAFGLLRAVVARQLMCTEIWDVMDKVMQMCVTSPAPHVRTQARELIIHFLLEYPIGRGLKRHIVFFTQQMAYPESTGRESVLEMVHRVVEKFPKRPLSEYCGLLFVTLCSRLANEEMADLREMAAACVRLLIERLDNSDRDHMFGVVVSWLKAKKYSLRRLGTQVLGLFCEAEEVGNVVKRAEKALPLLTAMLDEGQCGEKKKKGGNDSVEGRDHLAFQALGSIMKMVRKCPAMVKEHQLINSVWSMIGSHLLHEHTWVRLSASQLLGQMLSSYDPCEVAKSLSNLDHSDQPEDYLLCGDATAVRKRLRGLAFDLTCQLQPRETDLQTGEQAAKNLVFISKVMIHAGLVEDPEEDEGSDPNEKRRFSLRWLTMRMRKEANMELTKTPKNTVKRTVVFHWFAAVSLELPPAQLHYLLPPMLPLLVRETSETSPDADLRSLACEVADLIRGRVGAEKFARGMQQAQAHLTKKRMERKGQRKREFVVDPTQGTKRKISKQLSKETKKRKVASGVKRKAQSKKRKTKK